MIRQPKIPMKWVLFFTLSPAPFTEHLQDFHIEKKEKTNIAIQYVLYDGISKRMPIMVSNHDYLIFRGR